LRNRQAKSEGRGRFRQRSTRAVNGIGRGCARGGGRPGSWLSGSKPRCGSDVRRREAECVLGHDAETMIIGPCGKRREGGGGYSREQEIRRSWRATRRPDRGGAEKAKFEKQARQTGVAAPEIITTNIRGRFPFFGIQARHIRPDGRGKMHIVDGFCTLRGQCQVPRIRRVR